MKDTVLTEHGCILIVSVQKPEFSRTPTRVKGRDIRVGVGSQGVDPSSNPCKHQMRTQSRDFASAQADSHGPIQSALQGLEAKMEQRLEGFRQKAQATHAILEKDLNAMREDIKDQAERQKASTKELNERVNGVGSALTGQLAQFISNLQSTLAQQKSEPSGQWARQSLTAELRSQMSAIRKRTTSPSPSEDKEGDKRMKGK